ncbi:hypothetical protein ELE36_02555 [Pseudolysobacter antarcticus]|uniref:Uncharacterized protein n=1 Tax=Pseudolysobacter antarcticus TaxID=2511995 RepID=A0A411HFS1_9GAMM|nr:hypothetical protein [Pseudolysobacter antarcticus]QBB69343.1 hypothetical protein ELE36_02555 [Pseudolysobacter antarcticus]
MTPDPIQFRPILIDLLDSLRRVSRIYRSTVLYAPTYVEAPGWDALCALAERTAAQTHRILDDTTAEQRGMDCELRPPVPTMSDHLGEKIRARRALSAPRPLEHGRRAPRMGLH